jgi:hypothetical protein
MVDFTTTIRTAINRALDGVMDGIASDGLDMLNNLLVSSGFLKSEYLKSYELSAEVQGHDVSFMIHLESDSIELSEEDQKKQEELEKEINKIKTKHKIIKKAIRQFKFIKGKTSRVYDNRTTSADRLAAHEVALKSPRGMAITPTGKLFVTLSRAIKEADTRRFTYPKRGHEGIMKDFLKELNSIIENKFFPEIESMVKHRLNVL